MNVPVNLPWRKALAWVFLSTLLISGSLGAVLLYWRYHRANRASDSRYTIVAIIQSSDSNEPLQTDYLAELLGLSMDQPSNLYRFNTQEAAQKLLTSPIIKSAEVKKILPGMIYVKYSLRKPAAYIGDYLNAAIDEDGRLIPAKPFYTPKNIPELFLGLPEGLSWGNNIFNEKTALAQSVLNDANQLNFSQCQLRRIDVSKAFSKRFGEREIVLSFETNTHCSEELDSPVRLVSIVRFSPDNWQSQLLMFPHIYERIVQGMYKAFSKVENHYVIDMRISQLAFIGEER